MPVTRLDALPGGHDGIIVALLPDEETAARLAVDGGVPVDELHLTLTYLGDTDSPPEGLDLETLIGAAETLTGPVVADVTGSAVLNPDEDDAATVLLTQAEHVTELHGQIVEAVGSASDFPDFLPHVTVGYGIGPLTNDQASARSGQVRFDRVAVGWGQDGAAIIDLAGDEIVASAEGLPSGWVGVLAPEGAPTGDGRVFDHGALTWGELPLVLRDARSDEGGHNGAVGVGWITEIWRESGQVYGRGTFDLETEEGRQVARIVGQHGRGVSVDLDDVDIEVRVAADLLDDEYLSDEPDEEGRILVDRWSTNDEMSVVTSGRIRAATLTDIPAFVEAKIAADPEPAALAEPVVASSAPSAPPAGWFTDPQFTDADVVTGPDGQAGVPVTVTDEGRVYGHLALWRTCHTGYAAECVTPPVSEASYRYFHTGVTRTDGGDVATGRLTVDTLHAGRRLTAADTSAHYEHTGAAVADVVAGEDAYGIWIAGAVRPGASAEQVAALRSSPLSGDWRRIGTSLELVAALAVNSPGFPVPRALVAGGHVQVLQSGAAWPDEPDDVSDILGELVARERTARSRRRSQAERARSKMLVARAAQARARIGV